MKADVKLRAEWLWVDRWMGSSAFLLPMGPRGLYREMLSQAWLRGAALPHDPEAIRRATGCSLAEWKRYWPEIEKYWRVDGDSLVNDTQLEVYAEALAAQERASEHGRRGAEARWAHARASARASAQAIASGSGSVTGTEEKSTGAARRPVEKAVENQVGTFALYTVLAKEALDTSIRDDGDESFSNVSAVMKALCAKRQIAYDGQIVTRAIDAVLATRERKAVAS